MLLSANADARSIDHIADLGYEAIDIRFTAIIPVPDYEGPKHDDILDDEDWQKNLDPIIARAKERKIKIGSVHLPYRYNYTKPEFPNYDLCHEMCCRALRAAEYMGAEWAVMHIRNINDTVNYVKRLFRETKVRNVGIAIENIADISVPSLIETVDILASEGYRVGICFDTGHAHVNAIHENDIIDVMHRFGKRIKVTHVHDNWRNSDHHRAPYMGSIPWERVMETFKEIGYEGAFNYELMPKQIPAPIRESYEKYAYAAGRYLLSIYDNYDPEAAKKNG